MKKSVKVRLICLITAAVMLSGAVAVAAFLGSPYETVKNSLLDAMTCQNATMENNVLIYVNGELVQESKSYIIMGDDSSLSYDFNEYGEKEGFHFTAGKLRISPSWIETDSGEKWYYAQINPYNNNYYSVLGGLTSMLRPEDRNSAQMRFLELLADVLIGDLKNNITMTSDNGIRYIRGTLTGNQVPELVKAGIEVLVEQSGSYYGGMREERYDGESYIYEHFYIEKGMKNVRIYKQPVTPMGDEDMEAWENGSYYSTKNYSEWGVTYVKGVPYIATGPQELVDQYEVPATRGDYGYAADPLNMPMKSLVIDYLHGEAEIDADGNLLYLHGGGSATAVNIFDEVNVVEVNVTLRLTDIGSSTPACPIPGAEMLFTEEYFTDRYGYGIYGVYFKLDENGRIDEGSITPDFPNWLYDRPSSPPSETVPGPVLKYEDSAIDTIEGP